jgi:hypothetical protein
LEAIRPMIRTALKFDRLGEVIFRTSDHNGLVSKSSSGSLFSVMLFFCPS